MGSLTTEPDSPYENVMVKLEAWQAERSWWHWEVEVAEAVTNSSSFTIAHLRLTRDSEI